MPRTPGPEDVQQVGLRPTRDVVSISPGRAGAAQTAAFDRAAELTGRLADQQNELALHRADLEAQRALDGIRERMLTDDDWETQPKRAREEASAVFELAGQNLRGSATQRVWQARSMDALGRFETQMRGQARARGAELVRADLTRMGADALETAGDLTQSEEVRRAAVLGYTASLQSAAERGLIGEDAVAREVVQFTENVRNRARDGLRSEIIARLSLDPDILAEELGDPEGPFSDLPPDERARYAAQASQQAGLRVIDSVLEETLRTGTIVSDQDARLAGIWDDLDPGARLNYARRAAEASQLHGLAAAIDSTAGLSLPQIMERADRPGSSDPEAWAARQRLNAMRGDPAAYMRANDPTLAALLAEAQRAFDASQQAPNDANARINAAIARQSYGRAMMTAQATLGLGPSQRRLLDRAATEDWARRVRRHPVAAQQRMLAELERQMLRQWVDEDLASQATADHMDAYYRLGGSSGAPGAPPQPAQQDVSAAQGADYDAVRSSVLRSLNQGGDPDMVGMLLSRLSPADQARLLSDQEVLDAMEPAQ